VSETTVVVVLLCVNAAIAALFAAFVHRRVSMWTWPPPWPLVVAGWLVHKAVWLAALAACWWLGWVEFGADAPRWGRRGYLAILALFAVAHAVACYYWVTGRNLDDGERRNPMEGER
jgi:lysylphosphatidylglycerol synthetase-like protein (DUF2156 family)